MTGDEGAGSVVPASWPYSVEMFEAFAALKNAGFTAYCCGDHRLPHVLVAVYDWGNGYGNGYVDVVNVRGGDRVTTARLPKHDDLDVFAPRQVVWHYMGTLDATVAALLRLPPSDHPDAPTVTYPAPLTLFVSSGEQRPMTIKPGKHA